MSFRLSPVVDFIRNRKIHWFVILNIQKTCDNGNRNIPLDSSRTAIWPNFHQLSIVCDVWRYSFMFVALILVWDSVRIFWQQTCSTDNIIRKHWAIYCNETMQGIFAIHFCIWKVSASNFSRYTRYADPEILLKVSKQITSYSSHIHSTRSPSMLYSLCSWNLQSGHKISKSDYCSQKL